MPLLEVENLSVAFGGLAALSHVSLGVERGEIVGLIGPNGAGKTTLFNAVTGFVRPTGGEIRFKGEPITGWPSHRICWGGIARTFQLVRLLPPPTGLDHGPVARSPGPIHSRSPTGSGSSWPALSPPNPNCCCSTRCCPACAARRRGS